ncbi:MAG: hypothetical protein DMG62_22860 [Acidobacteria bacterium]|nr:MAG: hypothetical protein DMG63_19315 [Acidobacteriota bacterium]PYY20617.1 MAG: hypothetical protein DMG62_22860 [Acidobacteriota bacterium]
MTRFLARIVVSGILFATALLVVWLGFVRPAHAQILLGQQLHLPSWFPPVWQQSRQAPMQSSTQPGQTPATIPQFMESDDPSGRLASYQPAGATATAGNAFFSSLGTNGRTCFSCHQPQSGWAMNPGTATDIFYASQGNDPLFAPVDGANCPDVGAAAQTIDDKAAASSQLLTKGNIRVFIPVPANAEYQVSVLSDPYGCENSADYGLPSGMLSMYRRVLNATNLTRNAQFGSNPTSISAQGTIMWDGREPSLQSQFIDATLGHAQAGAPPTDDQVKQGVNFEIGLFTTQNFDNQAGRLSAAGATGGPVNLSRIGVANVPGNTFLPNPLAFHTYDAWTLPTNSAAQASINRGQAIFNTRTFTITGVAGFNDAGPGNPAPNSTCSTCHNTLNVGSDVVPGGRHLGIGDYSGVDQSGNQTTATALPPTDDQPLFSFLCPVSSIPFYSNPTTVDGVDYDEFETTDPGMGLITGKCADLGKFKVPRLNGLAARAPYFHNGNADTLRQVVDFYDARFNIGLSEQDKQDLINFLNSL